jgi:hypothetical protein
MVKPFPSKTHIGNHTLYPETPMLNYGYDPQLSEGASRAELARDCLRDLRMWPECESVVSVSVLRGPRDRFFRSRH